MMIDSYGDYWLGGENGLIHINNTAPYQVDWFRQDSDVYPLRHNRIRHIYEDSSNDIWIASDGGVGRYDRRNRKFVFIRYRLRHPVRMRTGRIPYWKTDQDGYG